MAAIALERVSKRFGATVVADDLSLEIADGEFFVFLGPSGCGKSTLLHLVAGVEPPSSGRIRIGGTDVTDLPPQKRDVAMVFQAYALYPHLDVAGNLAFPLRNRGLGRRAARAAAERVAAALGLTPLLDKHPRQLSGGQRQRVALGRALVRRPAAFLMDEPLSNLDAALRIEIREEIKRVHQAHRITAVYVTHDQTEAMTMADQVILLREGRVEQDAAPADMYARPATTFAARFVGTPPMNLLRLDDAPGRLIGVRPEDVRVGDAGLPARVMTVEYLGPDTVVTCALGADVVAARVPGRLELVEGKATHLTWAPAAQHVFDAVSGARLAP